MKLGASPEVSAFCLHLHSIYTGSAAGVSYVVDLSQLSYSSRWSQIHRSLIICPQLLVLPWDINYTGGQNGLINRKHCDAISEKNSFLLAVFWDFITSNAPRMPANTSFLSAEARTQSDSKGVKAYPMGLGLMVAIWRVALFKIGRQQKKKHYYIWRKTPCVNIAATFLLTSSLWLT